MSRKKGSARGWGKNVDNLGITLKKIFLDIVKWCYGFENPEAVAGCGRYARRETDGDKIIYILYPYRKKQNMFWIKADLLFMKKERRRLSFFQDLF